MHAKRAPPGFRFEVQGQGFGIRYLLKLHLVFDEGLHLFGALLVQLVIRCRLRSKVQGLGFVV